MSISRRKILSLLLFPISLLSCSQAIVSPAPPPASILTEYQKQVAESRLAWEQWKARHGNSYHYLRSGMFIGGLDHYFELVNVKEGKFLSGSICYESSSQVDRRVEKVDSSAMQTMDQVYDECEKEILVKAAADGVPVHLKFSPNRLLLACNYEPKDAEFIADGSSSEGFEIDGISPFSEKLAQTSICLIPRIYFSRGNARLSSAAKAQLKEFMELLKSDTGGIYQIQGHADSVGGIEANLVLAEKRAIATRDFLIAEGANPKQLTIIAFGKERPLTLKPGRAAQDQNRRVEIYRIATTY